jgi:hypothetical protein
MAFGPDMDAAIQHQADIGQAMQTGNDAGQTFVAFGRLASMAGGNRPLRPRLKTPGGARRET